jgi:hypothetical protein
LWIHLESWNHTCPNTSWGSMTIFWRKMQL